MFFFIIMAASGPQRPTNLIPHQRTIAAPKCCIEKDSEAVFGINAVFNLPIYPGKRMGSVVAP